MKSKRLSLWNILFLILMIISIYPILFGISNSFKTLQEAYQTVLNLIPRSFTVENYSYLAQTLPILKITMNTFFIASIGTVIKLITSFLAAFALTFYHFSGRRWLYMAFIASIFVPFTVTMIPNYLMMSNVNLLDTSWGVILPQLADATGIFLLVQTMRLIPRPLIEAAKIDDVSDWIIMKSIVFPLTRHAFFSTGIWFFIATWNEYIWPRLILKSVNQYTLPIAIQNFISAEGGTNFTVAMAVTVITIVVPLALYLIFQRFIIASFTSSGIK